MPDSWQRRVEAERQRITKAMTATETGGRWAVSLVAATALGFALVLLLVVAQRVAAGFAAVGAAYFGIQAFAQRRRWARRRREESGQGQG